MAALIYPVEKALLDERTAVYLKTSVGLVHLAFLVCYWESTMSDRILRMQSLLQAALTPEFIDIEDESHLHAGHAGARDGHGYYALTLVSDRFDGRPAIARHRMVYAALGDMMSTDIHALRMNLYAADEFDANE
jgi:BolA protein